jgi:hypothetical protein
LDLRTGYNGAVHYRYLMLFIAVGLTTVLSAEAQNPNANPLLIDQHFYGGVSFGVFDGFTTSAAYGAQFGWVGPTKTLGLIGGMAPEVSFGVQYLPTVHLAQLWHIPDAIAKNAIAPSMVVGPRFGGQLGFRSLFGLAVATGKAPLERCSGNTQAGADNWILFSQMDNGKAKANDAVVGGVPPINPLCGKSDRRFPFMAEIGPDLQLKDLRITLPVVITRFGDRDTRSQFSLRLGVDFSFGWK